MEEQGKGFITVNVRTAGGALPVEGASVTVSTSDGINSTVVAVMFTDSGGASEVISAPGAAPVGKSVAGEQSGLQLLHDRHREGGILFGREHECPGIRRGNVGSAGFSCAACRRSTDAAVGTDAVQ